MMKQHHLLSKQQSGFTLIELVVVIALLGILAVVAVPNFTDISGEARTQALAGIVGALNSADKMNKTTKRSLGKGVAIATTSNCATAAGLLLDGGVPSGYSVTPTSAFGSSAGDEHTCTLTFDASGDTATFTVTTTE